MADPPYNINKDFGNNKDCLTIEQYIKWMLKWVKKSLKLLKPNGVLYIYGYPEILSRISARFPIDQQRILAWHYTNKTTPSSKFWQRSYESILCLWNEQKPKLYIDQIREPYTPAYFNFSGKKRKETLGRFGSQATTYKVHEKGALPRDVIKIPALAGGAGLKERFFLCRTCENKILPSKELKKHLKHDTIVHPTQKPQALTEKLINSVIQTNTPGNVLIPFVGSGSELLVAKRMNLNYIGIEINPDYVFFVEKILKNPLH
ncbi:site-specific DNA-methyltransferase [Candidatus Phytoplasma pruni]|uniref:Methyltransferase n=1 Tax=Candidatus Phytoplasma pruni TaxID=479893 RepID=A0A851HAU5_9MOLU|nr:site-specific DNA-methyltransferase [Candidatus Phytoplasma pruni]